MPRSYKPTIGQYIDMETNRPMRQKCMYVSALGEHVAGCSNYNFNFDKDVN